MTPHFYFKPCNGKEPEGKEGDEAHIISHGQKDYIFYCEEGGWHYLKEYPVPVVDWNSISILTPVEDAVVLTRQQVGEVWEAADKYADERQEYRYGKNGKWDHPDKETYVNSLFK